MEKWPFYGQFNPPEWNFLSMCVCPSVHISLTTCPKPFKQFEPNLSEMLLGYGFIQVCKICTVGLVGYYSNLKAQSAYGKPVVHPNDFSSEPALPVVTKLCMEYTWDKSFLIYQNYWELASKNAIMTICVKTSTHFLILNCGTSSVGIAYEASLE